MRSRYVFVCGLLVTSLLYFSVIKESVFTLPTHVKKPSYRIDNRDVDLWSYGPGYENVQDDNYTYCKQVVPLQVSI